MNPTRPHVRRFTVTVTADPAADVDAAMDAAMFRLSETVWSTSPADRSWSIDVDDHDRGPRPDWGYRYEPDPDDLDGEEP